MCASFCIHQGGTRRNGNKLLPPVFEPSDTFPSLTPSFFFSHLQSNNVIFRESTDRKLVMITCQPISANEELFMYKGKHMPCAYPRAFHSTRGLNPENLNRLPYIESTFTFRQRKRRASSIGTPAKRIAMGSGTPQPPPSRSFQSEDGDFNDSVFLP